MTKGMSRLLARRPRLAPRQSLAQQKLDLRISAAQVVTLPQTRFRCTACRYSRERYDSGGEREWTCENQHERRWLRGGDVDKAADEI